MTCRLLGEGFLYDLWRHVLPVLSIATKGWVMRIC